MPHSERIIITLLGAPGSGKSTQGKKLSNLYKIPFISIGDQFRHEVKQKTPLGELITYHDQINPNDPCPDQIQTGLIALRLANEDCKNGFILDGFPRTPEQASALINTFMRPGDKHICIYMDVNKSILDNRLVQRYICPSCQGQVKVEGDSPIHYCPEPNCHKAILQVRKDGRNVEKRFQNFNEKIEKVVEIIRKNTQVYHFKLIGNESPNYVFIMICTYINQSIKAQAPTTAINYNLGPPIAAAAFLFGYAYSKKNFTASQSTPEKRPSHPSKPSPSKNAASFIKRDFGTSAILGRRIRFLGK